MSEHTPGPWEVSDQSASVHADGEQVAQTAARPGFGMSIHWDMETRRANARLIAAAPDLLEAVEAMVRIQGKWCTADEVQEVTGHARAAIAKARGDADG